jgi:hypothetical protein
MASIAAADSITGIYSNLYYHQEGGEVLGEELSIVIDANDKYYGVLQCAQGTPDVPMVIPLKIKKGIIKFKVTKTN